MVETIGLCEKPVKNPENFGSNLAPEMYSTRKTVNPTI
jgi:hypothetical protein